MHRLHGACIQLNLLDYVYLQYSAVLLLILVSVRLGKNLIGMRTLCRNNFGNNGMQKELRIMLE